MLYEKINAAKFVAMKNKDLATKNILTIFQGDVTTLAKKQNSEVTDELCLQVLAKMKKALLSNLEYASTDKALTNAEIGILNQYLPKQLSQEEILSLIQKQSIGTLKEGFAYFAANHKGLYDSKMIIEYFKGN